MEKPICDEATIAEHNRYKCHYCGRQIKKGMPILGQGFYNGRFGYQHHKYCYKCAKEIVMADKKIVGEYLKTFKKTSKKILKLIKDNKKILILYAMENK
jgi:hypothetical protein